MSTRSRIYPPRTTRASFACAAFVALAVAAPGWAAAVTGSDAFAKRQALTGNPATGRANNVEATAEKGEPSHSSSTSYGSVWWKWKAPANGTVTVTVSGDKLKPAVSIYTGTDLILLEDTRVRTAESTTPGRSTSVSFSAKKGVRYQIAVATVGGRGKVKLTLSQSVNASAIAAETGHDLFAYRPTLAGTMARGEVCNLDYQDEDDAKEPEHSASTDNDNTAWWKWVAPVSGKVSITVKGESTMKPAVSVYTGNTLSSLVDSRVRTTASLTPGIAASVDFLAAAGTEYQIAVDTVGGPGNLTLDLSQSKGSPGVVGHDLFAYRTTLIGTAATGVVCNHDYASESDAKEPDHSTVTDNNNTAWWRWKAPQTGKVTISLTGHELKPSVAVYTGTSLSAIKGTRVRMATSNTKGIAASVTFVATMNTEYQIAAETVGGSGNLTLSLTQSTSSSGSPTVVGHDDFALRPALAGASAYGITCNAFYGVETSGEPDHSPNTSDARNTTWWSWKAPSSGTATLTAVGANARAIVAAYTGSTPSALTPVGRATASANGQTARATFAARGGTVYQFAVDTTGGTWDNLDLAVNVASAAAATKSLATASPTAATAANRSTERRATGPAQPDFTGDAAADMAVFRTASGEWYVRQSEDGSPFSGGAAIWGAGGVPIPADYDGDTLADFATFHAAAGQWRILGSRDDREVIVVLGGLTTVPVPADYDGDTRADIAGFEPATGRWTILQSGDGRRVEFTLGGLGVVPVPGDYDGDGKADLAVYVRGQGLWIVRQSGNGQEHRIALGTNGALPVPGDYDQDGKTDAAIFVAAERRWSIAQSSNGTTLRIDGFGDSQAVPVQADYDHDGKTDAALYVPTTGMWYVHTGKPQAKDGSTPSGIHWGAPGATPASVSYQVLNIMGIVR